MSVPHSNQQSELVGHSIGGLFMNPLPIVGESARHDDLSPNPLNAKRHWHAIDRRCLMRAAS